MSSFMRFSICATYCTLSASTGEALLTDGGTVSHTQAMEKAKAEYKKYQAQNLSPVEEEYLQTIRSIEKAAKEGEKR